MNSGVFSQFSGEEYDRLQPVRIETYEFYHGLALDFMPFEKGDGFRFLDLGCGTGTFLAGVLKAFPESHCLAVDYSNTMLEYAKEKTKDFSDRVEFRQMNLGEDLPDEVGTFDLVSSFSAIHHLTEERKAKIFCEIYDSLEVGGWFFFIDAMSIHFDDHVFRLGKKRWEGRRKDRYQEAGFDFADERRLVQLTSSVADDSPDRDRISSFAKQEQWLRDARFRSVDHVWHYWMEHFLISRK